MSAPEEYVVPGVLRAARFVPRQAPGRREPLRVTAGAFRARGVEVPEDRALHNAYQLSPESTSRAAAVIHSQVDDLGVVRPG